MGCLASKDDRVQGADYELLEPVLDFESKVMQHGDIEVVQCSVQGWRKTMEDVALVQSGVHPNEDMLALGVFDGHSGSEAAQFAKEKLIEHIQGAEEWRKGDISGACITGFLTADEAMRNSGVKSGTTAVLALVTLQEMVVANCGDSRSVLSRGRRQLPMSLDHKPGRKAEKRRILKSGGYLDETEAGHPRVVCDKLNVSIATSRALGDFDFKGDPSLPAEEQMISPVPEFYTRERVPEDEFLILATDGVWDVIDNPGIVQLLHEKASNPQHTAARTEVVNASSQKGAQAVGSSIEDLAQAVLLRCLELGSRDNMTLVLADLRPKPPPDRERPETSGAATVGEVIMNIEKVPAGREHELSGAVIISGESSAAPLCGQNGGSGVEGGGRGLGGSICDPSAILVSGSVNFPASGEESCLEPGSPGRSAFGAGAAEGVRDEGCHCAVDGRDPTQQLHVYGSSTGLSSGDMPAHEKEDVTRPPTECSVGDAAGLSMRFLTVVPVDRPITRGVQDHDVDIDSVLLKTEGMSVGGEPAGAGPRSVYAGNT